MKDKILLVLLGAALVLLVAWTGNEAQKFMTMERAASTRAWQTGVAQVVGLPGGVTGNAKNYCAAVGATAASFTLPTTSDYFRVCAVGGSASVLFHSASLDATTAVNGHDICVGDGMCHTIEVTNTKASVIGGCNVTAVAGGEICFIPLVSPGGTP